MNDNSTSSTSAQNPAFITSPSALRIEDNKVTDYLLNELHVDGGPKAKFFKSVGLSDVDIEGFKSKMREHAANNPISTNENHSYGIKLVVDCHVAMPNGKSYCIRTVWNDHQDGESPKLITAHPLG